MSRRFAAAAILAAVITTGSATASAATARHGLVPGIGRLKAAGHSIIPRHGGTADSTNWSGYAVTPAGNGITSVTSTFTVPVAGLAPPGFAATWTGIGGYSSSDLIQAGAAEQSAPNTDVLGPQYYAWYELLPAGETQLTDCTGDSACTVTPGDKVTVTITQVAGNTWSISEVDAGHWTWSKNVGYASSESSAEWILEAPTVGAQTILAPVGTVGFGPTSTYTAGGVTHTIAAGDPTQIDLSPGLVNEATPSALAADGETFNVCAYAQSCAAP